MQAYRNRVIVAATSQALLPRAEELAQRLGLPILLELCDGSGRSAHDVGNYELLLIVCPEGLKLKDLQAVREAPVSVDFTAAKLQQRTCQAGAVRQSLAKAVGIKPGWRPNIIDATAGLGRDAFILASLGCHVTLIERHPIVAELLKDGIERAALHPETAETIRSTMKFIFGYATDFIAELSEVEQVDVIYIDPMFPHRSKSALIKKEMRLFQSLVGIDEDAEILLGMALQSARKRVVVKRPNKGPCIKGKEPDLVMTGKSTRYDIYFTHH